MSERFNPRQVQQDPDSQLVGAFGGLSSASYQQTGDILYADKLVNAYVTNRNEIKRRSGTRIVSTLATVDPFLANNSSFYTFSFDNVIYKVFVIGTDVFIGCYDKALGIQKNIVKSNVFPSQNAGERVTFSLVVEGDTCFVLMNTKSSFMRVLVILRRDLALTTNSGSTLAGTIANPPATSIITNSNTCVFKTYSGAFIDTTAVSQSGANLSITTAIPHGNPTTVRIHSIFWCTTRAANYYPGNYLYDVAARKNAVNLDVNVQVPAKLADNPLINENQNQRLDLNTLVAYKTNSATATQYTRVTNNQPTTEDQYEFSDGGFLAGNSSIFTTRTPAYLSFGALQAGGSTSQVYCFRLRELVLDKTYLGSTYTPDISGIRTYVNKSLVTPTFYDASGGIITTGQATYFSFATNNRPGINLSAVVELVLGAGGIEVDLDTSNPTITIADGYVIPLYGFGAIRTTFMPDICTTIGNRVVLAGIDNRVHFSNSNWYYRGIGWNNFQVSTIDFQATSAYTVRIGQESSKVLGIASVNGVLIVATDLGIFRVSGDNATQPPNATSANVAKISNELVPNRDCLLVYDNKVFFCSVNGLYQLDYLKEAEEILVTPLSTQVSDYFKLSPVCLTYSQTYRAFMVSFSSNQDILAYLFESNSWSVFKFSFDAQPFMCQSFDGVAFNLGRTGDSLRNLHYVIWDASTTTDLANTIFVVPGTIIPSRSLLITTSPTSLSNLVTPAEMIESLDPGANNLVQAYGDNHAKVTSGSVTVAEYAGGATAPIKAYLVTKAFYSDKLMRSNRVRAVNVLANGSGSLLSRVVLTGQTEDNRGQMFDLTSVNSSGTAQDKTSVTIRVITGDVVNIRLRYQGVNEAWALAFRLDSNLVLLGWQLDTSVKKRGRLLG